MEGECATPNGALGQLLALSSEVTLALCKRPYLISEI